jgi:predicted ATP-grasp superfamily ATP-dependent carboligase
MPSQTKGAVVIGGFVNGLGLVRALAARGIPCAVVTTKPYDIAHRSRWVVGHEHVRDLEESAEALIEALERRASEWAGWALLSTNDEALSALARHHDRLAATYRVLAPPWEVVRSFVDKERMLEVARTVGADLPRYYGRAEDAAALPDLPFPVLVKPIIGYRFSARFGCKLFVVNDREELRRAVARLAEAGTSGQVFDFVPGPDSQIHCHCTYVGADGEPSAGVTVRKIRQSPPFFGVARVAEVVDVDRGMRDATVEMLRRIGHRGFAAAEFKLDPRDGRFRFIEVNGRSVLYNGLLRRAGLDLAALAWTEAMEGRPVRVQPRLWPGVWIHLHADVLYSALWRRQDPISLGAFWEPYRRPKEFAVWSAADPAPFLAQWSRTARTGVSALVRGDQRSVLTDRSRPPESAEPSPLPVAALSETTARSFSP